MAKKQPSTKTASITLRANGEILTLLATAKTDGTAVTTVTTRNAEKKSTRGMTESHKSMDVARAHLATLATKAESSGWKRSKFGEVVARPDAFSTIPAPAKASA